MNASLAAAGGKPAGISLAVLVDRQRWDHEVSILIDGAGGLGWWCGVAPRSNRSMMIMRPPQQGQRFVVCGSAALGLIALMASTGMIGGASSWRARATFSARWPLASRP